MPGTTIGINMTYGYPGQASRQGDEVSPAQNTTHFQALLKLNSTGSKPTVNGRIINPNT